MTTRTHRYDTFKGHFHFEIQTIGRGLASTRARVSRGHAAPDFAAALLKSLESGGGICDYHALSTTVHTSTRSVRNPQRHNLFTKSRLSLLTFASFVLDNQLDCGSQQA